MDRNKKTTINVFPWKEILGFLGVVLAAYIGYWGIRSQTEIPIQATQTAEARLTLVSPITSATSALSNQSDTPTATTVSAFTPSTNMILFDTTHQEWGVSPLAGRSDRNIVESLGYKVDLLELPSHSTITTINLSPVAPDQAINFEFSTTDDYPVIGVWLMEAPSNAYVILLSDNATLAPQFYLWSYYGGDQYVDVAFSENLPGDWIGNLFPEQAENYKIQIAAFDKAPINADLLKQYRIVWFHNALREFLPQEQKDITDYLISGGSILIVDKDPKIFDFLFVGAFPDSIYEEQGASIRLFSSSFGLGRIALVMPKTANPVLYQDSPNQETSLNMEKIRQILNWLETGSW